MATGDQRRRQRGFALAIFLIILVLGVVFATVSQLEIASRPLARGEASLQVLTQAKEALIGYAATYRDTHTDEVFGYLPCPDIDGDGSADTAMTATGCGLVGETVIGLLPYRTLGMADLRDASGACLWYAVSGRFKASLTKATPLNWDTQGQLAVSSVTGQTLVAPEDAAGGAAAVIIAVGTPLAGQSRAAAATPCNVSSAATAWAAYVDSGTFPGAAGATITLVDGNATSNSKNDHIAWVTPREIFERVKKRSDFTTQINSLSGFVLSNLTTTTPNPEDVTIVGNKKTGKFPAAITVPSAPTGNDYRPYRDNWRDMFRYVLCSPLSQCLTVNGAACTGALLFAGERSAGGPRTASEAISANSLFEAPNATAFTTTGSNTFAGATTFAATTPALDVVYCIPGLPPQPPLSTTQITAMGQQADPSGTVAVDTAAGTVTLGSGGGGTANGCFWYGAPIPFGIGLHIYFSFVIEQNWGGGSGFTFALADANATRNPGTAMCGHAGQDLGYGGSPLGALLPIRYPKLGVEFDLFSSPARDSTLPGAHVAIDYWGTDGDIYDDVAHGVGGNPAVGSAGVSNFPLNTGPRYYVRIDITRNYDDANTEGEYAVRTYVATSPNANCTLDANGFQKLSDDLANICPTQATTVTSTRVLNDPADGAGEAMKFVYLGLTQGMVDTQVIKIYDLAVQGR